MLHLLRVFFHLLFFLRVRKQVVTHCTNQWLVVEQTVTHCINLWLTVGSRRDFFLVKLEDGSFNLCWLFCCESNLHCDTQTELVTCPISNSRA